MIFEAFGYLLVAQTSQNCIHITILPHNQGEMANGHFANDYFLTLTEDE